MSLPMAFTGGNLTHFTFGRCRCVKHGEITREFHLLRCGTRIEPSVDALRDRAHDPNARIHISTKIVVPHC
jgi:hypothetical protein